MASNRSLIARFGADVSGFTKGVRDAGKELTGLEKTAAQAGAAIGKVVGGSIRGGLDVVSSAVRGTVNTVANASAVAAGAVVAVGAASVKAGVSYNVLQQRSRAAFTTILGSAPKAEQMMADIAKFASTSPFPRQAFIEGTQQLLAFGYSAKEIIPTFDAIQNAVAATGGSAEDLESITRVFAQVRSSGKITADVFNQLGARGINAAELIGRGMGMTADQVRTSVSKGTLDAGKAMAALTDQMNRRYAGAAAGLKGTWVGATDRIKGAMRDVGSAIVTPFIDPKGGGYAITWANKVADLFRALEPQIGGMLTAAFKPLRPILDGVGTAMDRVVAAVKGLQTGGAAGLLDTLKQFAPVIAPIAAGLLTLGGANILGALGPVGAAISAILPGIGPLGAALGVLALTFPQIRAAAASALPAIRDLGAQLGPVLSAALSEAMPHLQSIATTVSVLLSAAIRGLIPLLGRLLGSLAGAIPTIAKTAATLAGALVPAVGKVLDVIGAVRSAGAWLADTNGALTGIAVVVTGVVLPALTVLAARGVATWVQLQVAAVQSAATQVAALYRTAAAATKTAATWVVSAARSSAAWLAANARTAASFVASTTAMVASRVAMLATSAAARVAAAGQWLLNAALTANPIGLVVAALAALVGAVVLAYRNSETFRRIVQAAWQGIQVAVSYAWNSIIKPALTALTNFFRVTVPAAATFLRDRTVAAWTSLRDGVVGRVTGMRDTAAAAVTGLRDRVVGSMTGLRDRATGLATGLHDAVTGKFRALADAATRIFGAVADTVGRAFGGIGDKVRGPLRTVFGWLNETMIRPLNTVTSKFGLTVPSLPKLHTGGPVPGRGERDYRLLGGEGVLNRRAMRLLGGPRGLSLLNAGGPADWFRKGSEWINTQVKQLLAKGAEVALKAVLDPIAGMVAAHAAGVPIVGDLTAGVVRQLIGRASAWGKTKDAEAEAAAGPDAGTVATGSVGSGPWVRPVAARVGTGYLGYPRHYGVDMPAGTGTPVHAVSEAMVASVRHLTSSYGKHVILRHAGNLYTLYAHLSAISVAAGQTLKAAQVLGRVGSTGNSTGPHLHFETRPGNGYPGPNPVQMMRARGVTLDTGGLLRPGFTLAYNGTGGNETVRTAAQEKALNADPPVVVNVTVNGALDPDAVARQILGLLNGYTARRGGVALGARTRVTG